MNKEQKSLFKNRKPNCEPFYMAVGQAVVPYFLESVFWILREGIPTGLEISGSVIAVSACMFILIFGPFWSVKSKKSAGLFILNKAFYLFHAFSWPILRRS